MKLLELLSSAFSSLAEKKQRTFLTILGMIVSINAAIIIHVAGGTLRGSVEKSLMSAFNGNILVAQAMSIDDASYIPEAMYFSDEIISEYEDMADGKLKAVYDHFGMKGRLTADGSRYSDLDLIGVNNAAYNMYNNEILYGRFISDRDCAENRNTVVLSDRTALWCFGREDITGECITINDENGIPHQFTVIGVFRDERGEYSREPSGGEEIQIPEMNAFISYTLYRELFPEYVRPSPFQSFAIEGEVDTERLGKMSYVFFNDRMKADGWEIGIVLLSDLIKQITDMITMLTYVITIIAVISMIIGGIGIMNIMMVSINERIREIGVKKAVGAGNARIVCEFLAEAVMMSLLGAVIGVVSGLISALNITSIIRIICHLNNVTNIQVIFYVPYKIIIFSIVFSIITGVLFGIFPALKTLKMNVSDALRAE